MRVPVATFNDCARAEPIQKQLVRAGVDAKINDELFEKLWFVSPKEADVRIDVALDQADRAQQLLLEWDAAEGILRDAIRCPECGSLQVHYPQFAHRALMPNLLMGFLAKIGLVEKEYYCEKCHYTWPKDGTKRSILYPHREPYHFVNGIEQAMLRPQRAQPQSAG
jgi:ribosomal protein S27AE